MVVCGTVSALYAQTETTEFYVDGIKVIFKPTVKEIIDVRMFYKGGVANYTKEQAGIERFALTATEQCGTQKYNANSYKDQADKYGVIMRNNADADYGDIEMECVSKYFNEGWDLFAESIVNPVFENSEMELLRSRLIGSIKAMASNPDEQSSKLVIKNAFEGTPYETNPYGDEDVVKKLTVADVKAYYSSILNKNQIFLVVAGKISKDELEAKIKASFSGLPSKEYTPRVLKEPVWNDYKVLTENRETSTNYISAIMNAPQYNSPEYVAYRMGLVAFGGALFNSLRTQLNLSYSQGATAISGQMPYGLMYVSTTRPKEAVQAMTSMLIKVKNYGLSSTGLQHLQGSFITNFYIRQQSSSSITGSLGEAEILGGWYLAEALPGLVTKTTADQIRDVMNKYIVGLRWSYLGNAALGEEAADAFKDKVK